MFEATCVYDNWNEECETLEGAVKAIEAEQQSRRQKITNLQQFLTKFEKLVRESILPDHGSVLTAEQNYVDSIQFEIEQHEKSLSEKWRIVEDIIPEPENIDDYTEETYPKIYSADGILKARLKPGRVATFIGIGSIPGWGLREEKIV